MDLRVGGACVSAMDLLPEAFGALPLAPRAALGPLATGLSIDPPSCSTSSSDPRYTSNLRLGFSAFGERGSNLTFLTAVGALAFGPRGRRIAKCILNQKCINIEI